MKVVAVVAVKVVIFTKGWIKWRQNFYEHNYSLSHLDFFLVWQCVCMVCLHFVKFERKLLNKSRRLGKCIINQAKFVIDVMITTWGI